MNRFTSLHGSRRSTVGAIVLVAAAASLVVWSGGAVAASSGPRAHRAGSARIEAAQPGLYRVNDGTSQPGDGDQSGTCSVTTVVAGAGSGPDGGTPQPLIASQAPVCSTDTTPGSTDSGPAAGSTVGSDPGPGAILGPFNPDPVNPGPDAGIPEPVVSPDPNGGSAQPAGDDQSGTCSVTTVVAGAGSGPDSGTPQPLVGDQAPVCSTDTTPGSTDSGAAAGSDPDPVGPDPINPGPVAPGPSGGSPVEVLPHANNGTSHLVGAGSVATGSAATGQGSAGAEPAGI